MRHRERFSPRVSFPSFVDVTHEGLEFTVIFRDRMIFEQRKTICRSFSRFQRILLKPTNQSELKHIQPTVISRYIDSPPTLPFAIHGKSRPVLHASPSRSPSQRFRTPCGRSLLPLKKCPSPRPAPPPPAHGSRTNVGIITSFRKSLRTAQTAPVSLAHRTCSTLTG